MDIVTCQSDCPNNAQKTQNQYKGDTQLFLF